MRETWGMRLFLLLLAMLFTACEGLEIRGGGRPPPTLTCYEHLLKCLDTPLGSINGTYGQSICVDCFDLCKGDPFQNWPPFTGSLQSCRWWDYLGWIASPVTAPDAALEEGSHVE
jgi:hypothetical protein